MRNLQNLGIVEYGTLPTELFVPLLNKVQSLKRGDFRKFSYNLTRSGVIFKYNQLVPTDKDMITFPNMKSDEIMLDKTITYPIYDQWKDVLDPVTDYIVETYMIPGGIVNKLMLSNLIPGGSIIPHWDEEAAQLLSKRVHVVIITNQDAALVVDGISHHCIAGAIHELNNIMEHSAYNNGTEDRIHLIIDYYHQEHLYELLYGRKFRDPDEADCKLIIKDNKRVDYSAYPKKVLKADGTEWYDTLFPTI
jgi:Aspartyl/Asparaginyl beta-hydroxylase